MKGFYFSLDALIASGVFLTLFLMVISQPVQKQNNLDHYKLDKLHTANMQPSEKWDNSYSSNTIMYELLESYYNSNTPKKNKICRNYFNISDYAIYISNQTETEKVCGNINAESNTSFISETTITPSIKSSGQFKRPKKITLVMKY